MIEEYINYLLEDGQHLEKLSANGGNLFRGLLIKVGRWKGYTYTEEELKKAIPTLIGKFITLDHEDRFNDHVGIITNAYWDDNQKGIIIDFKILDSTILNKLNALAEENLLHQVGLSAEVSYTTISSDPERIVKGINFKKATLTFYPAVRDARLITKLSDIKYKAEILEESEDGSLIVKLEPIEKLAEDKEYPYPYPAPEEATGKYYPAPTGYPIPPEEWKAIKEAIADLQKRVADLEKKVLKNENIVVENPSEVETLSQEQKPNPDITQVPQPQAQVQPQVQPIQVVAPQPTESVSQPTTPQAQPVSQPTTQVPIQNPSTATIAQAPPSQPSPQPQEVQSVAQPMVQPQVPTMPQAVVPAVQTVATQVQPQPEVKEPEPPKEEPKKEEPLEVKEEKKEPEEDEETKLLKALEEKDWHDLSPELRKVILEKMGLL